MFQRLESLFYMFTLLSASIVLTTGNDLKEEDRRAHSDRRGLWFGPRLGKRSAQLPEDNREVYYRLLEAADALKYYYDQLPISYLERRNEPDTRVTKKVIFTPKLGRSLDEDQQMQYVDFTPRLGRRVAEDIGASASDREVYRSDGAGTRFFSPRLGRHKDYSPRLGRDVNYDNYPDRVRVARSVNDTKTSKR